MLSTIFRWDFGTVPTVWYILELSSNVFFLIKTKENQNKINVIRDQNQTAVRELGRGTNEKINKPYWKGKVVSIFPSACQ
jgi:hypothetical protein